MKKLLLVSAIAMGLVSASAMADQTSKHNFRITDGTYQSWNKPKQIGQGKPDFEIKRCESFYPIDSCNSMNRDAVYICTKGNVEIVARYPACREKGQPKSAIGQLKVYINGKQKDQYWVYQ